MRTGLSFLLGSMCLLTSVASAATGAIPVGGTTIPEPVAFALIGSGLLGLGILRRRNTKP